MEGRQGVANNTVDEEETIQQMEQLLSNMQLKMEQSKLQKSRVSTVVAQSADAVGPVLSIEVKIEGCPVEAMVDTGAQSTILSRRHSTVSSTTCVTLDAGNQTLFYQVPGFMEGVEPTQ